MNRNSFELTLLSEGQIWGNNSEPQLEVISKYGTTAAITDLCILTGGYLYENTKYNIDEDRSLTGTSTPQSSSLVVALSTKPSIYF